MKSYLTFKGVALMCVAGAVTHSSYHHIHRAIASVKRHVNIASYNVGGPTLFAAEQPVRPVRPVRMQTAAETTFCPPAGLYGAWGGFGDGYSYDGVGGVGRDSVISPGGFRGFTSPPITSSVPESSTWVAMTLGAAAVGGSMRYRRKVKL
jgi:hypothetical protein